MQLRGRIAGWPPRPPATRAPCSPEAALQLLCCRFHGSTPTALEEPHTHTDRFPCYEQPPCAEDRVRAA